MRFIEFKNVFKSFDELKVLRGVTFHINKGEVTAIIGKSGEGKSVMLKHMIGLLQADSGEIFINEKPILNMKKRDKKKIKSKLSYMFQKNALFEHFNIFDNIALPLREKHHHLSEKEIKERVAKKIKLFELQNTEKKYPSELSGGMQKRVALARALITEPEAVLFDEPTTGLDPMRKNTVFNMILEYQKMFGFTAVVVSHDVPEIFDISQRIIMLNEGKVVFEGDYTALKKNRYVLSFVNGEIPNQDKENGRIE